MEKIISAIFKVESEGYQAITELKRAPITNDYTVSQAVLVKKENGAIRALDTFDTGLETSNDTATGSLIGSLLGILGGPLGVLLGGSIGILAGVILVRIVCFTGRMTVFREKKKERKRISAR